MFSKMTCFGMIFCMLILTGCGNLKEANREIYAMDTEMGLSACGERCDEALEAAVEEINRLDQELSVTGKNSRIRILNESGRGVLSGDALKLMGRAGDIYEMTGGAFDVTVYPLVKAWGFQDDRLHVPSEEEMETLLAEVGFSKLSFDEDTGEVQLGEGMGVDLGGIAKGYASDRVAAIFAEYGVRAGIMSLGGNVQTYGTKPDGSRWKLAIRDPFHPKEEDAIVGTVKIDEGAVITSGSYIRYLTDEKTGETYHHILDPATGYPADSGLASVTIVSSSGVLADGLSTACYVMGEEKAAQLWRRMPEAFDMILVREDQTIAVTEGIEDTFAGNYPVTVIRE